MKTLTTFLIVLLGLASSNLGAQSNMQTGVEETFTFTNGDVSYTGTLSKPSAEGVYPLVIMISGTGPQTRDWKFGPNYRMARMIADSLTKQGIAVYRYDDRGSGESTGTPEMETSYNELAADIHAAVSTFRSRPDIGRIGLCGHSLGGILSIMEAAEYQDVDFIITLSGSFINGAEILRDQARTLKRWRTNASMTDEEVVAQGLKMVDNLESYAKGGAGLDTIKQILNHLIQFQIERMSPETMAKNMKQFKDTADLFKQSYEGALSYYTSPHQKSFLTYDASVDFPRVNCPVLVLFGEKDQHVTVVNNKPRLIAALQNAMVTDFSLYIVPKVDHGYTTPEGYKAGQLGEGITDYIGNWVNGR